jgi:hypothetical protein
MALPDSGRRRTPGKMGTWAVDAKSEPGLLRLKLEGRLTVEEARAFVDAHNEAIRQYRGRPYQVWVDISELLPLSIEAAAVVELSKRFSSQQPNFRGSAVLVASATVALQHRRTSIDGGVMGTELISEDEGALRAHLRSVGAGR